MRTALMTVLLLVTAACTETDAPDTAATHETVAPASAPAPAMADVGAAVNDAVGFTEDAAVIQGKLGSKHVVRLPSPGTDTWRAASSGEPAVRQTGSRTETTADGKAALVFQYEMLQAGSVSLDFERLEDGEVEGKRTVTFTVA